MEWNLSNLSLSVLNALNPVAFKLGTLEVKWYGIFIFIGFVLAIIFACIKLAKWYKVSYDPFFYFIFIGVPVSILGARLWSFIIGDAQVQPGSNFFIDYWNFQGGGLAIQGGVIFTLLAACIWFPYILRKPKYNVKTKFNNNFYVRQVSMWVYADAIIPCILVGQIIGRWGNFFNQEVYGAIVTNPEVSFAWLKTLMPAVYDNMFINGSFRQPLFLYESFANFWVFLILYVGLEFVKFRKAGDLGILYFVFYGIVRLIMEPFRDNDFEFVATIVTSVLFIVIGITLLVLNHLVISKNRKTKVWFMFWVKTKYYLNFNNWSQVRNNNLSNSNTNKKEINKPKTYGFIKPPVFTRTEEEMLFYNNH